MKSLLTIIKSPLIWRIMISISVFLLLRELKSLHREISRMDHNQSLIRQEQQEVVLANGRIAAQTGVLELRQKELNALFPELREEINTLNLKVSRVSAVSSVAFNQQKQIKALLRDSIAWVPHTDNNANSGAPSWDTLRYSVFSYHDEYYDVSGIAHQDRQILNISSRDTMTQVVYKKRKHPWMWIFSPKVLEQRVYFKNPNAHISYSRTINLVR